VVAELLAAFDTLWDGSAQQEPPLAALTFPLVDQQGECRTSLPGYADLMLAGMVGAAAAGLGAAPDEPEAPPLRILAGVSGSGSWPSVSARTRELLHVAAPLNEQPEHPFRLLVQPPGCLQVYHRPSGRALQLQTTAAGLPPWEPGAPLRNFLHWHLAAPHRALLHAGTLGIGGDGVLLVGEGGSGKSGTVLAGIRHGLQTVGDDYVLGCLDDGVSVHPLFRGLRQDPDGWRRVGLAPDLQRFPLNWQGKQQLTLEQVGAAPFVPRLRIRAVLLPVVTGSATTRLEPVDRRQAFMALAPSSLFQISGDRGTQFRFCAELVRRLPCFRLLLGTDPAEISGQITGWLERRTA
jgi:hypothetical protein